MNISCWFNKKPKEIKDESLRRFNEWSRKYDKSILQALVFRRSHDVFISHILHDNRKFRILDIGCGTGEFVLKLKGYKKDIGVFGVDISDEMINIAKEKAKLHRRDIDFCISDVEDIPYEDNYFDYVTCAHSFHHYPNKTKAIHEMFRVLKDRGKVMIIDGYKDGLVGKFIFDFIIKRHEVNVHHLHSRQFQRLMGKTGFKDIVHTVFNPFIPLLFTRGIAYKENVC